MIEVKRLLVPVDFSSCSAWAVHFGQELAEKFGAELHILHVLETRPATPQFAGGLALPAHVEEESPAAVEAALAKVVSPEWATANKVVRATTRGNPVEAVAAYAAANQIDLIVMGTHGRTGLVQVLLGSVAESIVRTAPCPVLVVRQPKVDKVKG